MKAGLDRFEAWGMCRFDGSDHQENVHGLLERFFRETGAVRFTIVFILCENPNYLQNIEAFRGSYQNTCLPAFHFLKAQRTADAK